MRNLHQLYMTVFSKFLKSNQGEHLDVCTFVVPLESHFYVASGNTVDTCVTCASSIGDVPHMSKMVCGVGRTHMARSNLVNELISNGIVRFHASTGDEIQLSLS